MGAARDTKANVYVVAHYFPPVNLSGKRPYYSHEDHMLWDSQMSIFEWIAFHSCIECHSAQYSAHVLPLGTESLPCGISFPC